MNFTITRMSEDGLEQEVWGFYVRLENGGLQVSCNVYDKQRRASTRKRTWENVVVAGGWNRPGIKKQMHEIPMPEDVGVEAIARVRDLPVRIV